MADRNRLLALAALSGGELCLCQIVDLLELAPSTTSRHMDVLYRAGLVQRRKEGRWHYFSLPGRTAAPRAKAALKWALEATIDDMTAETRRRLDRVRRADVKELTACYRN